MTLPRNSRVPTVKSTRPGRLDWPGGSSALSPGPARSGPYLAFQLKHLGDVLMTLPALGLIKKAGGRTGLVVAPQTAPLARGHPWVDELFVLGKAGGPFGNLWAAGRAIRAGGYRCAFFFDGKSRSLLAALLGGLDRRLTAQAFHHAGVWRPPLARALDLDGPGFRLAGQALRGQMLVAKALGLKADPALRPPAPPVPPESRLRAEALLAETPGAGPKVLLSLAGLQYEKSWPLPHFAEVCRALYRERDARLMVVGGPSEKPLAEALGALAGVPVANLCGRTELLDLIALCAAGDLFIGVDTGAGHMAALTEIPIISVFIWSNPARWAPQSPKANVFCYDWTLRRYGLAASDGAWTSAPEITPALVLPKALSLLP